MLYIDVRVNKDFKILLQLLFATTIFIFEFLSDMA